MQRVYDPCGVVEVETQPRAPRVASLEKARLGVLDNSKWNAKRLLAGTVAQLAERYAFAAVNTYRKGSFSRNAEPEVIEAIVAANDIALVAVGD